MKSAHILVPRKTHGGFHALCQILKTEPWHDARLTVGSDLPRDYTPDVVALAMGTKRSEDFGIEALHNLATMSIPQFGFFTTIDGMHKYVASGAPALFGDRVTFAILLGLNQTPTKWPESIRTIRILEDPNSTDFAVVSRLFHEFLDPPKPAVTAELDRRTYAA